MNQGLKEQLLEINRSLRRTQLKSSNLDYMIVKSIRHGK